MDSSSLRTRTSTPPVPCRTEYSLCGKCNEQFLTKSATNVLERKLIRSGHNLVVWSTIDCSAFLNRLRGSSTVIAGRMSFEAGQPNVRKCHSTSAVIASRLFLAARSASDTMPSLGALPDDELLHVLSMLTPRELLGCRRVCRRWRDLALHPVLWGRIHLSWSG